MDSKKRKNLIKLKVWNKNHHKVVSNIFITNSFFDPEDKIQVKYEFLRAREVDKKSLSQVCKDFGYTRETYRNILKLFFKEGLAVLFDHKRGPKNPAKITPEIQEYIKSEFEYNHINKADELIDLCFKKFKIKISRRSIYRILNTIKKIKKKQQDQIIE